MRKEKKIRCAPQLKGRRDQGATSTHGPCIGRELVQSGSQSLCFNFLSYNEEAAHKGVERLSIPIYKMEIFDYPKSEESWKDQLCYYSETWLLKISTYYCQFTQTEEWRNLPISPSNNESVAKPGTNPRISWLLIIYSILKPTQHSRPICYENVKPCPILS